MRESWRGTKLEMWLPPRRRTHYALGRALGKERRVGGGVGARRSSARVSFLGNCYVGE